MEPVATQPSDVASDPDDTSLPTETPVLDVTPVPDATREPDVTPMSDEIGPPPQPFTGAGGRRRHKHLGSEPSVLDHLKEVQLSDRSITTASIRYEREGRCIV